MVKIFERLETTGFAIIDGSHEKQQMATVAGLCDWDGEPAAAPSERISGRRESHPPSPSAQTVAALR